MIPVTQTKVVVYNSKNEMVVRGNCYAAAIASILELPITEVPNVETLFHIEDQFSSDVMNAWLASKGMLIRCADEYIVFHNDKKHLWPNDAEAIRGELKDKYYLVSGLSGRNVQHICIYKNGQLVHDPHPTREGLLKETYFEVIEPI